MVPEGERILDPMTSRAPALGTLLLAAILVVASACGGGQDAKDTKDAQRSGPDRSNFVPITAQGVAAVVDKHLGKQAESYALLTDDPEGRSAERTIEVTLRGADPRDSFTVSVYPPDAAQDQIVKGACEDSDGPDDPQEKVTCTPALDGGNTTLTHFSFGLSGGPKGSYLTASGSGPESRQAFAQYDGFTKTIAVSDKDLEALLADPDLGWETDPKTNKAGESLKLGTDD